MSNMNVLTSLIKIYPFFYHTHYHQNDNHRAFNHIYKSNQQEYHYFDHKNFGVWFISNTSFNQQMTGIRANLKIAFLLISLGLFLSLMGKASLSVSFANTSYIINDHQNRADSNHAQSSKETGNETNKTVSTNSPEIFDTNKSVKQASNSLNRFKTLTADFIQVDAQNRISKGKLYFKRPGKSRFEYTQSNPLLLISDGVTLTQIDQELETEENIPLKLTPLSILLKKNIDLLNDTEIISVNQNEQKDLYITLKDKKKNREGELILVFRNQNNQLTLSEWIAKDNYGFSTRVLMTNIRENIYINPRLFLINSNTKKTHKNRRPR